MIAVINIKSGIPDHAPAVYIGRRMPGRPASPLGNPYKLKHESERCEAFKKYREWLEGQMKSDTPARREIERLAMLASRGDLLLLCWCAPRLCHGEIVKEFVERLQKVDQQIELPAEVWRHIAEDPDIEDQYSD